MNNYKSHLLNVRQLTRKPTNDVGNTGPSPETINSKRHPVDWEILPTLPVTHTALGSNIQFALILMVSCRDTKD